MKRHINTIIVVAALGAVVWAARPYLDRYLKMQAIDGCMAGSVYEHTDKEQGVTTREPMTTSFEKCMQMKGY